MRRLLSLVVLAALVLPPAAGAGGGFRVHSGPRSFRFKGSFSGSDAAIAGGAFSAAALGFGAAGSTYEGGWREDPAFLIIDATPPDADVYLNGRRIGSAGSLVARALPIPLGPHVVQVHAAGFRPRAVKFVADGSFPVRVRLPLTAE
jgi:hypothetical protein